MGEEVDIYIQRHNELSKQTKPESYVTGGVEGPGMISSVGQNIGPTFGRPTSMTPLEFMPYILTDEHFFFGDIRGFLTNNSQTGGNAGIGYRHLREDWNAWGGVSLW